MAVSSGTCATEARMMVMLLMRKQRLLVYDEPES